MTVVLFIIFYLFLTFFSRGLLIFYKSLFDKTYSVDDVKVFNIPIIIFFPIISLFVIGNMSVLLNFFVPINDLRLFFGALIILFILFNLREKFKTHDKAILFLTLLFVPAVLAVSTYGLKLHFDSIDYHLNFQYWIRESNTTIGLSNLYRAYGWSTIYEYISANLWLKNNFVLLHFLNIAFFTFFYNFIIYCFLNLKNTFLYFVSISTILYSFLDNFGIGGGGNGFISIQMVGKPDLAVGVLFFIAAILLINDMLDKNFIFKNFFLASMLSLFAFQIKVVSVYLALLLIYYFYKLTKNKFKSEETTSVVFLISIFFIYILKNIAVSGCAIFPISQTCISNLYWTEKYTVGNFSNAVIVGNYGYQLDYNFLTWFNNWINHAYNFQVYSNFLISFVLIFMFNKVFFTARNTKKITNLLFYKLFVVLVITGFFFTGPTVRYGYGVFLISVTLLTITIGKIRFESISKLITPALFFVFIFSVLLTPRLYSYELFLQSPISLVRIEDNRDEHLQSIYLKDEINNRIRGQKCYIQPTCIKNKDYKRLETKKMLNYRVYFLNKN